MIPQTQALPCEWFNEVIYTLPTQHFKLDHVPGGHNITKE